MVAGRFPEIMRRLSEVTDKLERSSHADFKLDQFPIVIPADIFPLKTMLFDNVALLFH